MSTISRPSSRESRATRYYTPAATPRPSIHSNTPPPVTSPSPVYFATFGQEHSTWGNQSRPPSSLLDSRPPSSINVSGDKPAGTSLESSSNAPGYIYVDDRSAKKSLRGCHLTLGTRVVHFGDTQEQMKLPDIRPRSNASPIMEEDVKTFSVHDEDRSLLQDFGDSSVQRDRMGRDLAARASLNSKASTPDSLKNRYRGYFDDNSFTSKEWDNMTRDDESRERHGTGTRPSGLPSSAATPTPTIIRYRNTSQVQSLLNRRLPEFPVRCMCPRCSRLVTTVTRAKRGMFAYLMSAILLIFTVVLAPLPFCVDWFDDVEHICPACNCQVGVYRRF